MARKSHKSTRSRKQKKKRRVGDLPSSCRAGIVAALMFVATTFAFAAVVHDDWVDWGDDDMGKTSVSLWSRCADDMYGFRRCVELRNSEEGVDEDLSDAGLAAGILLIFGVMAGVLATFVTVMFAFGKRIGLLCFAWSRNAALSFFCTAFMAATVLGAWVAYSSIYFSTNAYKNADPSQTAGASFYFAVVASVLSGVATLGALINWWIDAKTYADEVYKKSVLTSVVLFAGLVLVALALGTKGWIRSPRSDGAKIGSFAGRVEVGLFQYCLVSGPMSSCIYLHKPDSPMVRNVTAIDIDVLEAGGTSTAAFLVGALVVGTPAAFMALVHGLRKDMGFLCFAKHRNGYIVFIFSIVFTAATAISWIAYSSSVFSDADYKADGQLKAGYSVGFAVAATVCGALATLLACCSRHGSPDWYASYYDDEASSDGTTTTDDETTATTDDSEEQESYYSDYML